jgi:hypothetical protein
MKRVEVKVELKVSDGRSVSMSGCRAHSGPCDQILLSVRMLLSESCCFLRGALSVERFCLSFVILSRVEIYQYLHKSFTFHAFRVQKFMYNIYKSYFSPGSVQQIMFYFGVQAIPGFVLEDYNFDSWFGHRISYLRLTVIFLSPSRKILV